MSEHERERARRWAAENGKRPLQSKRGGGVWFNGDAISPGLGDEDSDLPGEVYSRLTGQAVANHKRYASPQEAEEDFCRAWLEAVAEGWEPPL